MLGYGYYGYYATQYDTTDPLGVYMNRTSDAIWRPESLTTGWISGWILPDLCNYRWKWQKEDLLAMLDQNMASKDTERRYRQELI